MAVITVSRSQKRSASRRRSFKRKSKSPWNTRNKKSKYSPKNKQRYLNRSNPVAENKKVDATEISTDVGVNALGNPILNDFSENPRYLHNEPALDGELTVADLPTGARGFAVADAVFNFNPDSCLYQTQGMDDNSMIGSSAYQKLCAAKFLIKWPQPTMNTGKWNGNTDDMPEDSDPLQQRLDWIADPANNWMGLIPETPQSYHLYWGFVKTPTGYSDFTDPKREEVSAVDLERHINLRVEQWYNQRTDRIDFIPKVNNDIKIIGKKKLSPPWDNRTGRLPVSYVDDSSTITNDILHEGVIPDTMVKIKWPLNKKVHFQRTNNFSGDGSPEADTQTPVFYQNHSWLPFAVIVNWNASSLPKNVGTPGPGAGFTEAMVARTRRVPHVLINDITYYRDS